MGAVSKDEPLAEKEAAHDASANEQSAPDFDQLVSYLGQFGKYQKWLFFLLWVPAACMSISVYSSVFVEFRPSHHCKTSTCLVDQLSNLADPSCTLPIVANDSVCQVEDWSNVRTCDEYAYDTSLFTRYVLKSAVCLQNACEGRLFLFQGEFQVQQTRKFLATNFIQHIRVGQ